MSSLVIGVPAAVVFWIHALRSSDGFLLLDFVNLPFHEFGHLLFGTIGENIGLWGGTLFQLIVPFGILVSFFLRRDPAGTAFGAFWFGENLLNISAYIADARKMDLPLVGGGEHDWNIILSGLTILKYDTLIGGVVKTSGWLVMTGAVAWFIIKGLTDRED